MTKPIQVSEDILPIGEFKAHVAQVLRRLREKRRPLVITQHGKPAAVLITPRDFDLLRERSRLESAIAEGMEDARAGRVLDDDALGPNLEPARPKSRR